MRARVPALLFLLLTACGAEPDPPEAIGFLPASPGAETPGMAAAREALIAGPVTRLGVRDPRVLEALRRVDRRIFLPVELWPRVWEDGARHRPDGETITAVDLTGAMLQALQIAPGAKVLECGTRSGWLTDLLAGLAGEVLTIDARPEAVEGAKRCLRLAGADNVRFRVGSPSAGWPEEGPFDAVVVNGRVSHIPRPLYESLRIGGRIIAPVGEAGESQTLVVCIRGEETPEETRALLSVRFGALE